MTRKRPCPRDSYFSALTIVLTTGNCEGEAERLLFGGWETIGLTIGLVLDIWTEKTNDGVTYARVATQEDFDNRCILPEGWTAETLMQPHDSIPYNPDIANVFYRAGYIETWGQGIQKICDECIALGTELPRNEILGTGIRVYFPALKSALIDQPKVPKGQDEPLEEPKEILLDERIIHVFRENPKATYDDLAAELSVSRSTIKRAIANLVSNGRIVRIDGKRYGHWQIND